MVSFTNVFNTKTDALHLAKLCQNMAFKVSRKILVQMLMKQNGTFYAISLFALRQVCEIFLHLFIEFSSNK